MGQYNSGELDDIITSLRDAIIDTNNLSLALCWLVELFIALQAKASGKKGTFMFQTSDAKRQYGYKRAELRIYNTLVQYRNTYVHEGKYRANNRRIKSTLNAIQQFALNQCNVYLDVNSKQFDV